MPNTGATPETQRPLKISAHPGVLPIGLAHSINEAFANFGWKSESLEDQIATETPEYDPIWCVLGCVEPKYRLIRASVLALNLLTG